MLIDYISQNSLCHDVRLQQEMLQHGNGMTIRGVTTREPERIISALRINWSPWGGRSVLKLQCPSSEATSPFICGQEKLNMKGTQGRYSLGCMNKENHLTVEVGNILRCRYRQIFNGLCIGLIIDVGIANYGYNEGKRASRPPFSPDGAVSTYLPFHCIVMRRIS